MKAPSTERDLLRLDSQEDSCHDATSRSVDSRLLRGLTYIDEGDVLVAAKSLDLAKKDYSSALAILQPMAESDPINVLKRRAVVDARSRLERLKD